MILKKVLKAKITKVKITDTVLYYQGSIGIDKEILEKVGLQGNDAVQVLNYNNGERFETYIIEEEKGSKKIILYGPAVHKGKVGDEVCILAYAFTTEGEKIEPRII
ncbi:MAG: aspartate 1-decarboxylase [Elusimicrobia bacterium]|nr:aspartate 1-decarboxylase [Elusimicrobiota bacterium]